MSYNSINQQQRINWSGAGTGLPPWAHRNWKNYNAIDNSTLLVYTNRTAEKCIFLIKSPLARRMDKYWALSIQPKVRFEFSATSSSEWNSIFQNFRKREQPRELYPNFRNFFSRKLSFHSTLLPEFLDFAVEWFAFRNSTVSGISGYF